jgi:hypothetical protein
MKANTSEFAWRVAKVTKNNHDPYFILNVPATSAFKGSSASRLLSVTSGAGGN